MKTREAIPTARILEGWRNASDFTVCLACAELIDNSLDRPRGNATHILIHWQPKRRILTFTDNGRGISDLIRLFRAGDGIAPTADGLGRYGQGGTRALVYLADRVRVWTIPGIKTLQGDSFVYNASVDFRECLRQNCFPEIPNPKDSRQLATVNNCPNTLLSFGSGVQIELLLQRGRIIYPQVIMKFLSRKYSKAIRDGKSIELKIDDEQPVRLQPFTPGDLHDIKTFDLSVDGLNASGYAGWSENLPNSESGTSINCLYREIRQEQSLGGQFVYASVDLSNEWGAELTVLKDGIASESLWVKLREKLESEIEPIRKLAADKQLQKLCTRLAVTITVGADLSIARGRKPYVPTEQINEEAGISSPPWPGNGNSLNKPSDPGKKHKQMMLSVESATDAAMEGALCLAKLQDNKILINGEHVWVKDALDTSRGGNRINYEAFEFVVASAVGSALAIESEKQRWPMFVGLEGMMKLDALNGEGDRYRFFTRHILDNMSRTKAA